MSSKLVARLRQLALDIANEQTIGNVTVLDAASAIERLTSERDDYRAAYNRVATAARAVTSLLYNVGVETEWRDGDETDRVFAWYELEPLVKALEADIHLSGVLRDALAAAAPEPRDG